jgi:Tol biopolymer transport system component
LIRLRVSRERAMADTFLPGSSAPVERPPDDRLDSWKEIASYMKRDATTVQRWEKREGMPVHRHIHDKLGSVYAFRTELDAWARNRRPAPVEEAIEGVASGRRIGLWAMGAVGTVLALAVAAWQFPTPEDPVDNPVADGRFVQLTDFDGIEQAAALSRDGKLAAFQSDRDGQMDIWVTQVGSGQFHNLTRGSARDIVNPSVRTLGFSPDGTLVTFWARKLDGSGQEISVWGLPVLGGPPRRYLEGVAEFDWSEDGGRLVYHTPGPGDPTFVLDSGEASEPREIFSAPPGLHAHFPLWSPDRAFIYFVQGSVPDRMDIWRVLPAGGAPERITHHDAVVTHPVFLNARTLMYLATDSEGGGPWIHSLDLDRRTPQRLSFGIDRYTSLAASADGRRLVATLAATKSTLWRLPVNDDQADVSESRPISLTTGNGSSPRLGTGFLLYVTSKGTTDSIWKLAGDLATEVWSAPESRIIGGPAIARDGRRIAFSIRRNGQTFLYVANMDGTDVRTMSSSLELQGAPAWAPDGQSITVAGVVDSVPRLFSVPVDGGSPARLLADYSVDPVWSPDGKMVLFSGPDIGTTFPVKAANADGSAFRLSDLTLTRGARHMSFMAGRRSIVVLRGEIRYKNLWLIDLDTGAERQLTNFPSDFHVRDFDISADGREIVLEQIQDHSDIVLIEAPRR